jgi:hypothetical protein
MTALTLPKGVGTTDTLPALGGLEKPAKVARIRSYMLLSGTVLAFLPDDATEPQQLDILRQVRSLAAQHIHAAPPRLGWLEGRRIVRVNFKVMPWRVLRGLAFGIAEITGCPLAQVYQSYRKVLP